MAATAISLRFQPKRTPPITNPTFLHFFSSESTNPDDQNTPPPPQRSPVSAYFSDVKASLKQNPQPRHQTQSLEEIRRNLSQFHSPSPAPPSHNKKSPPVSFQELYRRMGENSTIEATNRQGVASTKPSFDAIRESLRRLRDRNSNPANNPNPNQARDPMSLTDLTRDLKLRPNNNSSVIGGTDRALPMSVFGKEMAGRKDGEREAVGARTEFVRGYGYKELGEKLRKLRPVEGKRGSDWFSFGELNERLARLREAEEKETEEKMPGIRFGDLRESLMTLQMTEAKNKKQMFQRLDVLGQLGGTPNFMMSPPKDQLVEKYFHPDNMSSSEKMKLELQKVRDEFKISESDCGSARVQVAQLTTKIKHLSTALDKKDKHSRKGLQAMVQRRKKLLKYLRRTDWDSYCLVLSKLGLRDNPDFKILTYPKKPA